MRQIQIKNIGLPDKQSIYLAQRKYTICLGNNSKYLFTSIRDAKCFLAKTNRFLNTKLVELNFITGIAYTEFRKKWLYLNESQEDKLINGFELVNTHLRRSIKNSTGPNGNHFAFNHLYSACQELLYIVKVLGSIWENTDNTVIFNQITYIKKDLDYFGP